MNMLYPFQKEGVDFLRRRRRAYLADEMGLGKTVQAIVATHAVCPENTIVVCPASVVENWRREWEEWGGVGALRVMSYSRLIRLDLDAITGLLADPDLVILDEAHYCKTPSSKRTKAALRLAANAGRAWLLSGTPMPNDPRELYPIFKYLWPGRMDRMGIRTAFEWMDAFCKWSSTDFGYRIYGTTPRARAELGPAWQRISLRRKLKDVALELPPLRFDLQYLPKDPALTAQLIELGADPDSEESMSTLRRVLGTYKAPLVAQEIIRELQDGQYKDIVVLYHHHDTGDELAFQLSETERPMFGFDGRAPASDRQRQIDGFQEYGGIFLAQQGAAGVGITLTRASEIVLVEPSWSPSDNEQAIKRIHRIGQDAPCRARIFVVPDSLDESLMRTLRRKSSMIKEVGL